MTTIANWINKETLSKSRIWPIGDTSVTNSGTGTNLSLESSKIFELRISCRPLNIPRGINLLEKLISKGNEAPIKIYAVTEVWDRSKDGKRYWRDADKKGDEEIKLIF